MIAPFVGFFCDHAEEVELGAVDSQPDFFEGFSDSAFVRRLAAAHFEFSADWAPKAFIGSFFSLNHKELAYFVTDED